MARHAMTDDERLDQRRNEGWRLLMLVPYLQAHPGVSVADAAAEFGVTEAKLRSELKSLWLDVGTGDVGGQLVDIDMDTVDGEGRIFLTNAEWMTRPMRLTPDEAMSLIVALRAVEEVATGEMADATRSALAKLERLVGARLAHVDVSVAGGDDVVRQALADAIAQRRRVQLTYDGATRAVTTTPVVDPRRTQVRNGVAYLEAFSLERDAWRTYRVERIRDVVPTGEPTTDHGEPPDATGWFDDLGDDAEVTLVLAPEATWITEYYPMREVTRRPDGRVVARFVVADPLWLTRLLLRLGSGVVSVDPPDAAAQARLMAREALTHYRGIAVQSGFMGRMAATNGRDSALTSGVNHGATDPRH